MSQTQPITTKFDYYSLVANLLGGGQWGMHYRYSTAQHFFLLSGRVRPPPWKKIGRGALFLYARGRCGPYLRLCRVWYIDFQYHQSIITPALWRHESLGRSVARLLLSSAARCVTCRPYVGLYVSAVV